LQKIIRWTKNLGNGRHEWENACVKESCGFENSKT